jgi:hypothetical protein
MMTGVELLYGYRKSKTRRNGPKITVHLTASFKHLFSSTQRVLLTEPGTQTRDTDKYADADGAQDAGTAVSGAC